MTMVIPIDKESYLQKLDEIDNSLLRPEFLGQMQDVQQRIFTKLKPKTINGKSLNGSMFV